MTPRGEILAVPERGTLMGNRGCLHDSDGRLGGARWRTKAWIACRLDFKGRRRTVMAPGRYTELFFTDEAVAFSAGHRPCAECRREDWLRFRAALAAAQPGLGPAPRAAAIDALLHEARLVTGTRCQKTHRADATTLPDGAFFETPEGPATRLGGTCLLWSFAGYRPVPCPSGEVVVLTPAPIVAALAGGYAMAGWSPAHTI